MVHEKKGHKLCLEPAFVEKLVTTAVDALQKEIKNIKSHGKVIFSRLFFIEVILWVVFFRPAAWFRWLVLVFPNVSKTGRFPFQVTKDMIAEASGSDLVLPSEEVEYETFVHGFSVVAFCEFTFLLRRVVWWSSWVKVQGILDFKGELPPKVADSHV